MKRLNTLLGINEFDALPKERVSSPQIINPSKESLPRRIVDIKQLQTPLQDEFGVITVVRKG